MKSYRFITALSVALLISSSALGAERKSIDVDKVTSTSKKVDLSPVSTVAIPVQTKNELVTYASPTESDVQILWQVVSGGATEATTGLVTLSGTLGQLAVGGIFNGPSSVGQGYWQDLSNRCCFGRRGNVDAGPNEQVTISDSAYLVKYLFGIPKGPNPPCREEGNANGDPNESVNIGDITFLISYLFGTPGGPEPPLCP